MIAAARRTESAGDNGYIAMRADDAEVAVLGSLLKGNQEIQSVAAVLGVEDFRTYSNQLVFRTILGLHSKGTAADLVTVADALEQQKQIKDAPYVFLKELWEG